MSDYAPINFDGPNIKHPVYNHTQDNHLDNISGIRTRAIEKESIFKMDLGWENDRGTLVGKGDASRDKNSFSFTNYCLDFFASGSASSSSGSSASSA